MENPFKVNFPNGKTAEAIYTSASVNLEAVLQALQLNHHQPTLVVIGGASKLSEEDFTRVQQLFVKVLAPLAEKWQAAIVDGGTDAGVMRLMGQARLAIRAQFPLIGVAPVGLAILPEHVAPSADAAALEPNHTHFILVPGSNWGDESAWIAQIASALAGNAASITVLINGGEVAWRDALQSVEASRLILVVAGSGRTADILADALRGESTDDRAKELIASGLVQAIDLEAEVKTLTTIIEEIFASKG